MMLAMSSILFAIYLEGAWDGPSGIGGIFAVIGIITAFLVALKKDAD